MERRVDLDAARFRCDKDHRVAGPTGSWRSLGDHWIWLHVARASVEYLSQHLRLACVGLLFLASTGCHRLLKHRSATAIPYTTQPPADGAFNERAKHLNSKGLRAFETGHLIKAEELFREALDVDVSFGPAHNNLGQIYLARHQLYLAAWEFEYAASLMPELAEPIINEGLAYETGERLDRAAEFYQLAYNRHPTHPIAIASLVRVRIKQDASADEIGFLLDELIMHDGRQEWVAWAKELRATRYQNQCEDCPAQMMPDGPGLESPRISSDSGFSAEQLLPLIDGPTSDLVPVPIEQLGAPDGTIWMPSVQSAPSILDQSSHSKPDKPVRIPFDPPAPPRAISATGVQQVSFEVPDELLP